MEFLPIAFSAMESYSQFIIYKLVPRGTSGKTDKLPISYLTGQTHDAHDSVIWMTAKEAINIAGVFGAGYGVGFVFTKDDPFFFLDIDDCLQSDNSWSPIAIELCTLFNGAAVEVSSSGRGLHIFGCGEVMPHECRNSQYHLEFYTEKRFVALTGYNAMGDARTNHTPALLRLVNDYFKPTQAMKSDRSGYVWTTESTNGDQGLTDDELIAFARRSASPSTMFGDSVSFEDLWTNNQSKLSVAYPPNAKSNDSYDRSTADMSLAIRLAFWTGSNCERIREIMMRSALVREKWDREDYLTRTIGEASVRQKTHYINTRKSMPPENIKPEEDCQETYLNSGSRFQTPTDQIEYFKGCIYVADQNKILVPGGHLLGRESFQAIKSGYEFVLSTETGKTTRNAWEAFNDTQAITRPFAHSICFKPLEEPGKIIHKDGERLVNIYYPIKIKRGKGDVSLFLNHINKCFPNPDDQEIIKAYFASLVQHQGVKFSWCIILQGVEGNGKSFFTQILSAAVGERYVHCPNPMELNSKFNDWQVNCTIIVIEDIYILGDQTEVLESMKIKVTNSRQAIEPKGGKKYMADICANYLINTNHKDGLRKTINDRRYAPFFMGQQSKEDLIRDGMNHTYFDNLFSLINKDGSSPAVSEWLWTYDIPHDLNPAKGCRRAPLTSSTEEAIRVGIPPIQQAILDAIEEGYCGMRNGWISSYWLNKFLEDKKLSRGMPVTKRKEFLNSIGYVIHPYLPDGRTIYPVQPDGIKSRLFIKKDHKDINLQNSKEIAVAYTKAQEGDR